MPDILPVTRVQRFSTKDGPGIRTTVFLKGCPLRCAWCHNPETQSFRPQLMYADKLCVLCGGCAAHCPQGVHTVGDSHTLDRAACTGCGACASVCPTGACEMASADMTVDALLAAAMQDVPFYGDHGGLTLSGGEPMAHPEEAIALLRAAKEAGLHTALETCGHFPPAYLPELTRVTDLFLYDYKDSDPLRHRQYTGVDNSLILRNLHALDGLGAAIELRCILVKTVNLTDDHLAAIAETYHALHRCPGVTLLPYHAYGSSKARQLGLPDTAHPEWVPTKEDLTYARVLLTERGVKVLD